MHAYNTNFVKYVRNVDFDRLTSQYGVESHKYGEDL